MHLKPLYRQYVFTLEFDTVLQRFVWWCTQSMLSFCVVVVFVMPFCPQGLPGVPSMAALHSNQILTVKVCLGGAAAQPDSTAHTQK